MKVELPTSNMVEGSGVKVELPDEAENSVVLRVLLVEDDPFQQMALSGIIARVEAENAQLKVKLKIAGTGDEALAALEAVESHLVLLDYKLPGGGAGTLLPASASGSARSVPSLCSRRRSGRRRCSGAGST